MSGQDRYRVLPPLLLGAERILRDEVLDEVLCGVEREGVEALGLDTLDDRWGMDGALMVLGATRRDGALKLGVGATLPRLVAGGLDCRVVGCVE